MSSGFVHLHNHTHYSLLDASATTEGLIEAAVNDGHPAIALTDHGVMFGSLEFYKIAKSMGIKPIIGVEAYLANGSRFDQDAMKKESKRKNYFHILLLAKNKVGYHNLMKLTSLAHTEGFYYKPRIDKELITKYKEGLICSSACLGSMVNSYLVDGNYGKALEEAKYFKDLFGDDFYIEIQNHNLPEDKFVLENAPKLADEIGAKLVATNDIHYIKPEDHIPHNILLNIRDAKPGKETDYKTLRYGTPEFYFKSAKEMKALFKDFPEAIQTTIEIADKCNLDIELGKLNMPAFPIPDTSKSETLEEYLKELTYLGLEEKLGELTPLVKQRADYELDVINSMGFPGYFLIVWDFIRAAKELDVSVGPGRGSAAGSLVAYGLDITKINPLEYDLLFERFLNPERVSMPDIDIDFNDEKRDKVIEYVKKKYGEEAVAQIITFGKLSSRAVLTDVGRVLGVDRGFTLNVTKKIPVVLGKVHSIEKAIEMPDIKEVIESRKNESNNNEVESWIGYSKALEGKFRHSGIHAAGVVIAPGPISDYVPIYKDSKTKDSSIEIATQYNMNDLEDAGLLKMDFLGLRTLSIIDNTLDMIYENYGRRIDVDKDIDYNDLETYKLFSRGETLSIFQFESGGMQEYLKQLKPENLEEITAMNALYRPGPMANIPQYIDVKHKRKSAEYIHPILEEILHKTNGIIVYQEQVMQLVQIIADFTLGQADILRRAMGKKKRNIMDSMKPDFIANAGKKGISEKKANEIFELIEKFADYGFNKSHSVAYSYLAFQTAWLKTHYPAEFLAANLTAESSDQTKIVRLLDEAKKYGIKILPPDVNYSGERFTATKDKSIYYGLTAIKNVGNPVVNSIKIGREKEPYKSFFDFVSRADSKAVNRRALEALICSGAFDSISNGKRAAVFESIDTAIEYARKKHDGENNNTASLFGGNQEVDVVEPQLPEVEEWTESEILLREKEYLNFYITGHPLNKYYTVAKSYSNMTLDNPYLDDDRSAKVCAIITEIRTRYDKKGNQIAFLMVEDFMGKAEVILWSEAYEKFQHYIIKDNVVLVNGKLDSNGENVKITCDSMIGADEFVNKIANGYQISLSEETNTLEDIVWLDENLKSPAGRHHNLNIIIEKSIPSREKSYSEFQCEEFRFNIDEEITEKLIQKFGQKNVRYIA